MPKVKTKRNREIKKLYKAGYSSPEIAKVFGITTQRVHQIVNGYSSFSQSGFSYAYYPSLSLYTCMLCENRCEVIHHKDRNSKNNNPDNLMQLCKKCHVLVHLELNKTFKRKYNTLSFTK